MIAANVTTIRSATDFFMVRSLLRCEIVERPAYTPAGNTMQSFSGDLSQRIVSQPE